MKLTVDTTPAGILRAVADHLDAQGNSTERPLVGLHLPPFGTVLPEQGGVFCGIYADDSGRLRGLVTPEGDAGERGSMEWGCRGKEIEGASSLTDGWLNTHAMAMAGSKMAKKVLAARVNGFNDWCIPAQKQLMACYLFHPAPFAKMWHWSSTQYSATSAWVQYFEDGYASINLKDNENRCRLVRSFPLGGGL